MLKKLAIAALALVFLAPSLVLIGIGIGAMLSGLNTMLIVMGNLDQAMAAQVWLAGSPSGDGVSAPSLQPDGGSV